MAGKDGEGTEPEAGHPLPLDPAILGPLRAIGPCAGWSFDASSPPEVLGLFETALEFLGGRLDILLHVAGISGRRFGDGPLHECSDKGWDSVMEVNALGPFLTNRAAVRIMLEQPTDAAGLRGTVVNVGSVLDRSPAPRTSGRSPTPRARGPCGRSRRLPRPTTRRTVSGSTSWSPA